MIVQIADCIRNHSRFEIITHEGPDADAVGSSRALAFALTSLGKSVKLVYPTPIPNALLFTPVPDNQKKITPEISIILDVSDMGMLGGIRPIGEIIVIDHHKTNNGFGTTSWVDSEKSSTAEMVYDLLTEMGIEITPPIATNLYMGIFGDTGGFIHANTTPRVFKIVYNLTSAGADPHLIAYKLNKARSMNYFNILCLAMERMVVKGNVYGSYIGLKDMKKMRARTEDVSGIVEEISSLAGADLVVFLRELNPDTVHCSIRSKNNTSALQTAQAFGGGGHSMAAGFTTKGRAKDLLDDVIEEGSRWLSKA